MRQDKRLLDLFKAVMTEFDEAPRILPDDEADGSTDVGNVSYEYQRHSLLCKLVWD